MDDRSGYIDLTSVQSSSKPRFKDVTPADFGPWLYSWNPCESFSMSQCSNVAVSASDPTQSFDIGTQDSVTFNKDVDNNWVLRYTSRDGLKSLDVVLECTPDSDDLTVRGEIQTNGYDGFRFATNPCGSPQARDTTYDKI
ncbi:Hypp5572 [Branchiostoma lanceolatum]|uniref:Hypp5572 protein n=1 Tax=Branchiostoma lanceolatum TaxID=7740 RepID=A0A8J9YLF5_BRALA|nr:Hypp5572 [Branchiostoma lanceolatum]